MVQHSLSAFLPMSCWSSLRGSDWGEGKDESLRRLRIPASQGGPVDQGGGMRKNRMQNLSFEGAILGEGNECLEGLLVN